MSRGPFSQGSRRIVVVFMGWILLLCAPCVAELCAIDAVPAATMEVTDAETSLIFVDGFESGDVSAWRAVEAVPGSWRVNERSAMFRRSLYGLELATFASLQCRMTKKTF